MPETGRTPSFPPGFWRRIRLHPYPDRIVAGLEDDVHRFTAVLHHHERRLVAVDTHVERYPWSTCTDAGAFLSGQLVGRALTEIERLEARQHCTHLYDLAVLSAAHVDEPQPVCLDMWVADRVEERTEAVLRRNGRELLRWELRETRIETPGEWAGRDLRELSRWKHQLTPGDARLAALLRRAVFVSGVRRYSEGAAGEAAPRGRAQAGACFTYQVPRIDKAVRTLQVHDFSRSESSPLQHFDPDRWAAVGRNSS